MQNDQSGHQINQSMTIKSIDMEIQIAILGLDLKHLQPNCSSHV